MRVVDPTSAPMLRRLRTSNPVTGSGRGLRLKNHSNHGVRSKMSRSPSLLTTTSQDRRSSTK
jgi:hypothetical protein